MATTETPKFARYLRLRARIIYAPHAPTQFLYPHALFGDEMKQV